jgi:hypothetical protein
MSGIGNVWKDFGRILLTMILYSTNSGAKRLQVTCMNITMQSICKILPGQNGSIVPIHSKTAKFTCRVRPLEPRMGEN